MRTDERHQHWRIAFPGPLTFHVAVAALLLALWQWPASPVPASWSNHAWQSTLFAFAVGLLTLGFKANHARVRYWLWFSASIKFLIPFSLLVTIGGALPWKLSTAPASPGFSSVIAQIGQPFFDVGLSTVAVPSPATADIGWIAFVIPAIWTCGACAVLWVRITMWTRVRHALRTSTPIGINVTLPVGVHVRAARGVLEPGVIGFWRPVILVPEGIEGYLSPGQLEAVLSHEICHIRRHDNPLAVMHMLVETVFWFHPLVWWIGGRLIDERERACDEDVLRLHPAPRTYAEGIIRVCERYVEARLACVSGVSGSDLKKRIEAIMSDQPAERLSTWKAALLLSVAAAMAAIPVVIGTFDSPRLQAQGQERTATAGDPAFEVVSVRPNKSGERWPSFFPRPGRFSAENATLQELITFAYELQAFEIFGAPSWATTDRFDIAATMAPSPTGSDQGPRLRRMLRAILAERFTLVAHEERREMPVYELVLARTDRKLGARIRPFEGKCGDRSELGTEPEFPTEPITSSEPSKGPQWCIQFSGVGRISARGTMLSDLARNLGTLPAVRRRVIDRTGFTGQFDFDLEWTPMGVAAPEAVPNVFTALQEQLGLELESTKEVVPVLVIDGVNQPSPN